MESSEREPSYYEVALTHRQVMVGLVVALTTVVVAFFAGIWIGRDRGVQASSSSTSTSAAAAGAPQAERITFFGEKEAAASPQAASKPAPIAPPPARAATPDAASEPAPPTPAENESAKLRQTLEAEMAANRVDGDEPPAVAPGARVKRDGDSPPAIATETNAASSAASSGGSLWIQVYSSTNGARAREISDRLKKSGFPVRTLGPAPATGANYRVRVGPYADRARADRVATRLRRELKLDTWITDSP